MQEKIHKLSEENSSIAIQKLRNFPTIPEKLEPSKSQGEILAQYFPWGCKKINQRVTFEAGDQMYSNRFNDYSNICLGIKYGICPFFNNESVKFINERFQKVKKSSGNFYLKLVAEDSVKNKILALARMTEMIPGRNFRFWHKPKGKAYPLGIAKLQFVAVGQIEEQNSQELESVYMGLKRSFLDWKYFRAADGLEQIQREKYVVAINKNECHKLEEQLEEKSLQMLDFLSRT